MSKANSPAQVAFKVLARVEIDGHLFTPDGGPKHDGVYADNTGGKLLQHWYFAALVTDGKIVPAKPVEDTEGSGSTEQQSATAAIVQAQEANAANKPEGMSDEQKAQAAAVEKANAAAAKAQKQAEDAKAKAAAKAKR